MRWVSGCAIQSDGSRSNLDRATWTRLDTAPAAQLRFVPDVPMARCA